jgi:hypothetical protein
MTHEIVVSRRDGILTAPDGTKYRIARGKTLADADHPAVIANPRDWVPMVISLSVGDRPDDGEPPHGSSSERLAKAESDVVELEETLDRLTDELSRLAQGLEGAGVELPAEEEWSPGWLVDLVLTVVRAGSIALRAADDEPEPVDIVEQLAPPIAPPKPRKRTSPPLTTRTGDDG